MSYDPRKAVAVPVTIQEAIDDVARIEQLVKGAYRLLDTDERVGERHPHLGFKRDDLLEKANGIIADWYGATLGATRK